MKIDEIFNPEIIRKFIEEHPDEVFTGRELREQFPNIPTRWVQAASEVRKYLGDGWWIRHPTKKIYYYGVPEIITKCRKLLNGE